ncbi:Fic family protein [Roseateles cellulosilyticus]|uniref:Fic family protein n=1 Tax=Pelomonas cellulosilytica TaxID=2906762 RepID=A0ABS8Y4E1_9BURK|nr:Fic family protein [Pelomonas sp. P8]MCE4558073.1 Fic family protein [Pelomonas sp. P8]
MTKKDIDAFFARSASERQLAPFREELLQPTPNIDAERARRCTQIQALVNPMDRKYLSRFLVDYSWASGLLEGSSYTELETEALVVYGERQPDKPIEDAVLALNHKRAAEHLWTHRELSLETICAMHALLTDDHGLAELNGSDHFLPAAQRGTPRVYEDVNLANSAYVPPHWPGTSGARDVLVRIVDTAKCMEPVQAALYLLTRIAYVQSFANGNKRTSRIAANLPLLAAGLVPSSFVDIPKAQYIRGMAAFYELGSMLVIEQTFIEGYVRSIIRSSNLPPALRGVGADIAGTVKQLCDFINSGARPSAPAVAAFLSAPPRVQATPVVAQGSPARRTPSKRPG